MYEPMLMGHSLTLLFLYFIWYSFLGWVMETIYCSVLQGHFVMRGFLKGPICPIYGVGALLMVLFLRRFTGNVVVFFLVSVVTLSAWEYLVGWLLDVTTHIKYWDYSDRKCNLHGRICLQNSLYWGVVAYVAIYWIHPATAMLFARLGSTARWIASIGLLIITMADTVTTIRSLALAASFLQKAAQVRAELDERRKALATASRQKLDEAAVQASLLRLELRERDMLAEAQHYLTRFRIRYPNLKSVHYEGVFLAIRECSEQLREYRKNRVEQMKELKQKIKHS